MSFSQAIISLQLGMLRDTYLNLSVGSVHFVGIRQLSKLATRPLVKKPAIRSLQTAHPLLIEAGNQLFSGNIE